jgi:glycosyltransferase involved in cell wall biosynthesis
MSGIESLALLDPVNGTTDQKYKKKYCSRKNCKYYNQSRLAPREVVRILQLSHCGLILSEHEGACRASCEYLAAGLPVISTPSVGGRDVWFDDYNSMIVQADPEKIKEAVEYFKNHPRDPEVIRRNFLEKAQIFRDRFKNQVMAPILKEHKVEMTADEFLQENPFFWWPRELKRRRMGTSHVVLEGHEFGIGNISPQALDYILTNIKHGSNILEFGSGLSSRELSKAYNVTSIEHNPEFINLYHQQYTYSELQKKDLHYREEDCLKALSMHDYDLILIDGPPAYRRNNKKSRLGFQKYVNYISKKSIIVFDDVHRFWDCLNLLKTYLKLKREVIVIEDGKKRTAILTLNASNPKSPIKLAYLLYKSFFYIYEGTNLNFFFKMIERFKNIKG